MKKAKRKEEEKKRKYPKNIKRSCCVPPKRRRGETGSQHLPYAQYILEQHNASPGEHPPCWPGPLATVFLVFSCSPFQDRSRKSEI
jgi:hypothetical protein